MMPNCGRSIRCILFLQVFETFGKLHPMQRVGTPLDVARAITFLASDAAGFITGSLMPVDGAIGITTKFNI